MLKIVPAENSEAVEQVRALMAEYGAEWPVRALARSAYAHELASLPGPFAPPPGALLLAFHDGEPAGCIALRKLEAGIAEIKRLYVRPPYRHLGLGRALACAVVDEARKRGYELLRLDTLPAMTQARKLYASLGFREIPPYHSDLDEERVFMEKALVAAHESRAATGFESQRKGGKTDAIHER